MRPLFLAFFRAGQAIAGVLLLGLATGCSYESLPAANGRGYRLGLALVPTAALLTLAKRPGYLTEDSLSDYFEYST